MPGDPAADGDAGSGVEGSSDSSSDDLESELESMTGKGIKRLCSELLELKKASDEDFRRNVHSNLSAFVRYSILEKMDVLLSEHQNEEALIILEMETKTFKKLQMKDEHLSPSMVSYMSAISDRKTRLADQFALVAEHSRVARPEFHKALSGLCKLGENNRANLLLLKFYRSRLECCVHELRCSLPFLQGTYIRELAKVIFSAISQASRSFLVLYGESSSHTSELINWAREEIEAFSHSFDKYVKSISEINGGLPLAIEAVNTALSFCALLKPQKIVLQPYLTKLIRPCMEELLQIHIDHYKKVMSISTTTDSWVLSKFLISGISSDKSSFTGIGGGVEYFLLTSSGIKFITLMQEIADDITPLIILHMESSILKGLTDLFNEYMHTLEEAFPNRGKVVEMDLPRISSAQKLQQQLSLLVNSLTLVHFFPSIVGSIVKGVTPSNYELFPEHAEFPSQNELDGWTMSIQEAANRLRGCFCQKVVYDVMSHEECNLKTSLGSDTVGQWIPSSSEVPMPSFAFQALFLRLRQIELSKSIFPGENGIMGNLFEELMEVVIVWLSKNQDFWKRTLDYPSIRQHSYFEQVHIDLHFLLETAKFGGCYSDELMVTALDLIAQIEATFTGAESDDSDLKSSVPDDEWASKAAKLAIEKLLEVVADDSDPEEEPAVSFGDDSRTQASEVATLSYGEGSTDSSEDSAGSVDDNSVESLEEDITRLLVINNMETESLEGNLGIGHYDDEGLGSTVIRSSPMGVHHAIGADVGTSMMGEIDGTEDPDIVGSTTIPELEPVDFVETETLAIESKFFEISDVPGASIAHSDLENETVMLRNGDLSDSTDDGVGGYCTISEELEQDEHRRVAEEVTADEASSFEEERLLEGRGNEPVFEEGDEQQGRGGGDRAGDVVRPRGGRQPPKHSSAVEGLGKKRKGSKAVRPKWQ